MEEGIGNRGQARNERLIVAGRVAEFHAINQHCETDHVLGCVPLVRVRLKEIYVIRRNFLQKLEWSMLRCIFRRGGDGIGIIQTL